MRRSAGNKAGKKETSQEDAPTITESLRFPHIYNYPCALLNVARIDDCLTFTLEGAPDVALVTVPADAVQDEITPTATAHVWCVWLDETAVRVSEGDANAICRMAQRAMAGEAPGL